MCFLLQFISCFFFSIKKKKCSWKEGVRIWGSGVGLKREPTAALIISSNSSHVFRWQASAARVNSDRSRSSQGVESCQETFSRVVAMRTPENHCPGRLVWATVLSRKGNTVSSSASTSQTSVCIWITRGFFNLMGFQMIPKLLVPGPYFECEVPRERHEDLGAVGLRQNPTGDLQDLGKTLT